MSSAPDSIYKSFKFYVTYHTEHLRRWYAGSFNFNLILFRYYWLKEIDFLMSLVEIVACICSVRHILCLIYDFFSPQRTWHKFFLLSSMYISSVYFDNLDWSNRKMEVLKFLLMLFCSELVNTNWKDSPRTMLDVYHELIHSGLRIWMLRFLLTSKHIFQIHLLPVVLLSCVMNICIDLYLPKITCMCFLINCWYQS